MKTYLGARIFLTVEPPQGNVFFKDAAAVWGTLVGILRHKIYAIMSMETATSFVILVKNMSYRIKQANSFQDMCRMLLGNCQLAFRDDFDERIMPN